MPLTPQEQVVKGLLVENHSPFEVHHVFVLSPSVRMSVDFLIFVGRGIVLECTFCSRKRGSAVSEIKRRCAFIDYRFGLLKVAFPKLVCGALVEAPNEDQRVLGETSVSVLTKANFVEASSEALGKRLVELMSF